MSTTTPETADAGETRIHFPESVTIEERNEAARLIAALSAAQAELTAFAAPAMGTRFDLEGGETVADYGTEADAPLALVCPWCRKDVSVSALYDLEVGRRHTYAHEIDSTDQVVAFYYGSNTDYDSVTFVHEPCGLPVGAPPNWEFCTVA